MLADASLVREIQEGLRDAAASESHIVIHHLW